AGFLAKTSARTRGVTRILAVTAVAAERDAVLAGLPAGPPGQALAYQVRRAATRAGELTCVAVGVGPAAAAAGVATLLATDGPYDAVLSVGVGGGFAGRAPVGSLVVADRVVLADLGADGPRGFLPADELGLGEAARVSTVLPPEPVRAVADRVSAVAATTVGPVLTVSTATGTDERAAVLATRHRPAAEAMEGGGVLAAALAHGVPFGELRAISNIVGRRDRSAWSLPDALALLGQAVATLLDDRLML
ncbi:MAG TPA: futalosine hydrolase, partial [Mycobacteriales bacterium]|nr:futalosine hydrolase [Mycobacteriales bacterium]